MLLTANFRDVGTLRLIPSPTATENCTYSVGHRVGDYTVRGSSKAFSLRERKRSRYGNLSDAIRVAARRSVFTFLSEQTISEGLVSYASWAGKSLLDEALMGNPKVAVVEVAGLPPLLLGAFASAVCHAFGQVGLQSAVELKCWDVGIHFSFMGGEIKAYYIVKEPKEHLEEVTPILPSRAIV